MRSRDVVVVHTAYMISGGTVSCDFVQRIVDRYFFGLLRGEEDCCRISAMVSSGGSLDYK